MWVQRQQNSRVQPASTVEAIPTCKLSMYNSPPNEQVSIEDFESFAIDRLKGNFSLHVLPQLPGILQSEVVGALVQPDWLL